MTFSNNSGGNRANVVTVVMNGVISVVTRCVIFTHSPANANSNRHTTISAGRISRSSLRTRMKVIGSSAKNGTRMNVVRRLRRRLRSRAATPQAAKHVHP